MTDTLVLANAMLVLPGETLRGSLLVRDGMIVAIDHGTAVPPGAVDCHGDFVCPGLVELHTDNLERHISPRPKVDWPHHAAIGAHDAELASTGITTVFDALRVGSIVSGAAVHYKRYARALADEILAMRAAGTLRISHHLHLRAETCSETLLDELGEFGPEDRVGIVSLMDHTPGQRQFSDLEKFADYVIGKHGMSRQGFEDYVAYLEGLRARLGAAHETGAVAAARRYGAVIASHDDTTADQVAVSKGHGVSLAEFPTTEAAAAACGEAGIAVIMGAPNLVRGGSHSGNVAARTLAETDRLDILSSDYVPSALLLAAVKLGDIWSDLPRGLRTVTKEPAERVGLSDRGAIEVGRRADLLRFRRLPGGVPVPVATWVRGDRVG
jgi:alpha-D-ribose 1-methylphosphonate 5-triphosphate diphosphatase